ncbi:DUF2783 domain-containing protein [Celeribacter ethanolicus]|uniref:DUF2783 domain-containing protein n=1 Tax=Celeribacter ethanolicus TaxID=1758178 RepID=A0A291GDG8_9RHOB|nr:DUF2783 domain-containing protein [Celeribacter ethanolicus]ATG48245.1 hypothetical protein CEW89_12125 [Celeribacter ethanolicus]TNE65805.1 MAG: DUF2783 domain-containing protein [Paracoccaceae bacterium]
MSLILTPNVEAPDDIYAGLIAAHEGLDREASEALNARLILILMNQIGNAETLSEALRAARGTVES